MNAIHYIGLDVHKKTISYCIKTAAGQIVKEGTLAAEHRSKKACPRRKKREGVLPPRLRCG
jgi:transposase